MGYNEILESVYKKEDITFNSLYGIHEYKELRAIVVCNNFQFPLWDT